MTKATIDQIRTAEDLTATRLGAAPRMLCAGALKRREGVTILIKYTHAPVDQAGRIKPETKAKESQKGLEKTASI